MLMEMHFGYMIQGPRSSPLPSLPFSGGGWFLPAPRSRSPRERWYGPRVRRDRGSSFPSLSPSARFCNLIAFVRSQSALPPPALLTGRGGPQPTEQPRQGRSGEDPRFSSWNGEGRWREEDHTIPTRRAFGPCEVSAGGDHTIPSPPPRKERGPWAPGLVRFRPPVAPSPDHVPHFQTTTKAKRSNISSCSKVKHITRKSTFFMSKQIQKHSKKFEKQINLLTCIHISQIYIIFKNVHILPNCMTSTVPSISLSFKCPTRKAILTKQINIFGAPLKNVVSMVFRNKFTFPSHKHDAQHRKHLTKRTHFKG